MKGEFIEHQQRFSQQHHHHQQKHENPNTHMFSKLQLPFAQHFQLSHDHEETSSPPPPQQQPITNTATPTHKHKLNEPNTATSGTGGGDGATIEVIRRPRGRPPGSKNKPKPPVVITREPEPVMSPYILEVQGGNDVVESISRFCTRRNIGVCVLTGSGTVANVTLRQPSTTPGATVTFHGRFDILSMSATYIPQSTSYTYHVPNNFTISLAGPQGQIVGGIVAGNLVAVGTVYIVAASITNPSYHRLPGDEDGRNSGSGGGNEGQSPGVSGAGGGGGGESSGHAPSGGGGADMYSGHLGSDHLWAPTARPPY